MAVAASLSCLAAPVADAATGSCGTPPLSQVFGRFGDGAWYTLMPNGGIESGSTGWTLSGGAAVAAGNETSYLRTATDGYSLSLPNGSSAVTPPTCASNAYPTVRFMALNTGASSATLSITAWYTDMTGKWRSASVGSVTAGSTWRPSPILKYWLGSMAPPGNTTQLKFQFAPQGTAGAWRIDDVYLDPFKGI